MASFSFIDFGNKDFLRDDHNCVIQIEVENEIHAEEWLLNNGEYFGWTNTGVRYWCWDDEE